MLFDEDKCPNNDDETLKNLTLAFAVVFWYFAIHAQVEDQSNPMQPDTWELSIYDMGMYLEVVSVYSSPLHWKVEEWMTLETTWL